jgi:transcriptional regulator with XRE-family HTH domain
MSMPERETKFATRLAQYREARGLSQKQLAARVGCSPALISKYEQGRQLPRTLERYAQLSAALTVNPADLVGAASEGGSPESAELLEWVRERTLLLGPAQVRALLVFFCAALARLEGEPPAPSAPKPEGAA